MPQSHRRARTATGLVCGAVPDDHGPADAAQHNPRQFASAKFFPSKVRVNLPLTTPLDEDVSSDAEQKVAKDHPGWYRVAAATLAVACKSSGQAVELATPDLD